MTAYGNKKYAYDARGNHKVYDGNDNENTSAGFAGNINPIRYRSYYWDRDMGMYYLRTRWYVEYLDPETVNGLNLFANCFIGGITGLIGYKIQAFSYVFVGLIASIIAGALMSEYWR